MVFLTHLSLDVFKNFFITFQDMHMRATYFFHMFNHVKFSNLQVPASFLHLSTPLVKLPLIVTAQDISFKGTDLYKGLHNLIASINQLGSLIWN